MTSTNSQLKKKGNIFYYISICFVASTFPVSHKWQICQLRLFHFIRPISCTGVQVWLLLVTCHQNVKPARMVLTYYNRDLEVMLANHSSSVLWPKNILNRYHDEKRTTFLSLRIFILEDFTYLMSVETSLFKQIRSYK